MTARVNRQWRLASRPVGLVQDSNFNFIESDVPAHPYQVMGVGSRRDWGISLTLDEVVAIKS